MTKKNSSFVDTDIIMKLGNFSGGIYLVSILKSYNYELYLHEYLLSEELIYGEAAIKLLSHMINSKELSVMKVSDLTPQQLIEYNSTLELLAKEMKVDLTKPRDRNAGEVKSMALV